MKSIVVSALCGALLGSACGVWSVQPAPMRSPSPMSPPKLGSARLSVDRTVQDPSQMSTVQLLSALRRLAPDAQLQVSPWREGRITPEMVSALDLTSDEAARLNASLAAMADEMAKASQSRVESRVSSDSIALVVPEFSPAGEARNRLIAQFRETIGNERTQLLLTAAGSREQLERECRFFGEYEQVMELPKANDAAAPIVLSEHALRYGELVDETGRPLGSRYVMRRVPLRDQTPATPAQLERFAGIRWQQLLPQDLVRQIK